MFNIDVLLLLLCTCFVIIKSEAEELDLGIKNQSNNIEDENTSDVACKLPRENNTIHIECTTKTDCIIAASYELIAGTQCTVQLATPNLLKESKFSINDTNYHLNASDVIGFGGNLSADTYACLNLHLVYTFKVRITRKMSHWWTHESASSKPSKIDVNDISSGKWKFSFLFYNKTYCIYSKPNTTDDNKDYASCETNVTIRNQDVEVFAACPKSSSLITDKFGVLILENYNKILIGFGFFGIIVICQTLFIVYTIRQKLVGGKLRRDMICSNTSGRYRDISQRPPQPLPLDIYDIVADEPELGFTNRAFNLADESTTPNVPRKLPRSPPHRRLRPAPNVVRKPPKALPRDSYVEVPNDTDRRIAPDVPRRQSQELLPGSPSKEMRLRALKPTNLNQGKRPRPYPRPRPRPKAKAPQEINTLEQRLTWEDDWQYEKLDPMQKYL